MNHRSVLAFIVLCTLSVHGQHSASILVPLDANTCTSISNAIQSSTSNSSLSFTIIDSTTTLDDLHPIAPLECDLTSSLASISIQCDVSRPIACRSSNACFISFRNASPRVLRIQNCVFEGLPVAVGYNPDFNVSLVNVSVNGFGMSRCVVITDVNVVEITNFTCAQSLSDDVNALFPGVDVGGSILIRNVPRSHVNVQNVVVVNATVTSIGRSGGCVSLYNVSYITIQNLTVRECSSIWAGGVEIIHSSDLNITQLNVTQSLASDGDGGGIQVQHVTRATLHHIFIENCSVGSGLGGGLFFSNVSSLLFQHGNVRNTSALGFPNGAGGGMTFRFEETATPSASVELNNIVFSYVWSYRSSGLFFEVVPAYPKGSDTYLVGQLLRLLFRNIVMLNSTARSSGFPCIQVFMLTRYNVFPVRLKAFNISLTNCIGYWLDRVNTVSRYIRSYVTTNNHRNEIFLDRVSTNLSMTQSHTASLRRTPRPTPVATDLNMTHPRMFTSAAVKFMNDMTMAATAVTALVSGTSGTSGGFMSSQAILVSVAVTSCDLHELQSPEIPSHPTRLSISAPSNPSLGIHLGAVVGNIALIITPIIILSYVMDRVVHFERCHHPWLPVRVSGYLFQGTLMSAFYLVFNATWMVAIVVGAVGAAMYVGATVYAWRVAVWHSHTCEEHNNGEEDNTDAWKSTDPNLVRYGYYFAHLKPKYRWYAIVDYGFVVTLCVVAAIPALPCASVNAIGSLLFLFWFLIEFAMDPCLETLLSFRGLRTGAQYTKVILGIAMVLGWLRESDTKLNVEEHVIPGLMLAASGVEILYQGRDGLLALAAYLQRKQAMHTTEQQSHHTTSNGGEGDAELQLHVITNDDDDSSGDTKSRRKSFVVTKGNKSLTDSMLMSSSMCGSINNPSL